MATEMLGEGQVGRRNQANEQRNPEWNGEEAIFTADGGVASQTLYSRANLVPRSSHSRTRLGTRLFAELVAILLWCFQVLILTTNRLHTFELWSLPQAQLLLNSPLTL